MSEELYRFVTREFIPNRLIVKQGDRYWIQLPMEKNPLWEKLHQEKVLVNILITWDWSRKKKVRVNRRE